MIVVRVSGNEITMQGHAGYAKAGPDLVCCAASVLAFTLAGALENLAGETKCQFAPGDACITFAKTANAKLLVEAFLIGILQLQAQYPGHVMVEGEYTTSFAERLTHTKECEKG